MSKKFAHKLSSGNFIERLKIFFDYHASKSYSQEGEDMILRRLFEKKHSGFYVDVGAHHPARFSNTYYFYKRGWRGINIDAMPGSMKMFKLTRPRDINLEIPVSADSKSMLYYMFNEPALNGFDAGLSNSRNSQSNQYKVVKTLVLPAKRLDSILDEYLPSGQTIEFLTIDVEGLDFEVLRSNDWGKYKPEVVLIEVLGSTLADLASCEITKFLSAYGYTIYAKAVNTVIYKRAV